MARKAAAAVAIMGVCTTVLIALVTSPSIAPTGEMLQADTFPQAGKVSTLALQDYNEYSDESASILAAALSAETPKMSPLQSLDFTPLKDLEEETPAEAQKKQKAYAVFVFSVTFGCGCWSNSFHREGRCVCVLFVC